MTETPALFATPRNPGPLHAAVTQALAGAGHLDDTDQALTALALRIAGDLDTIGPDSTADTARLARLLLDVLEQAGLTPAGRASIVGTLPGEETDPVAVAGAVSLQVV